MPHLRQQCVDLFFQSGTLIEVAVSMFSEARLYGGYLRLFETTGSDTKVEPRR